jgi:hypothetical protein
MSGLASGYGALALASRPAAVGGFLRFSKRDSRLLAELTAIARGPYEAVPWPEPPDVQLDRLVADFSRTTGRRLELQLRWENEPAGGMWLCDIAIDGKSRGSTGRVGGVPELALAMLADRICEGWLHDEVWGGWPMCPKHPNRPMWAMIDSAGPACWVCEVDPKDRSAIGQLGPTPQPEVS